MLTRIRCVVMASVAAMVLSSAGNAAHESEGVAGGASLSEAAVYSHLPPDPLGDQEQGVYTWPDGRRYEGGFSPFGMGEPDGRGVLTWPGGERFDGEFAVDGNEGILTWPDGRRFEGSADVGEGPGELEGVGVMEWPDGRRFKGELQRGQPFSWTGADNPNVLTWPGGGRYEGTFGSVDYPGRGVYTSPDGTRHEAEWRSDLELGQGVLTWPGGRRVTCFPCEGCERERAGCGP